MSDHGGAQRAEYVEVRCVDLNPFEPLGINEQIRFLTRFCCSVCWPHPDLPSPASLSRNQTRVVERGREPGLQLETDTGLGSG